ncbi:MAG TPA: CHRD domain-containing protein [Rubricoccaceae bacterium]|nr:CHRD domain-containing protein [Rubricoccaceae bacterium]
MRFVTARTALAGALLLAPWLVAAQPAGTNPPFFRAVLSGANEVPPNGSTASGYAFGYLDGLQLTLTGRFRGLQANYTASHIHEGPPGVSGPVVFPLAPTLDGDQRGGRFLPASNTFTLTPTQLSVLLAGNYYVNVHSGAFPPGEIRDQLRASVVLSEIRVDQPSTDNDEYFELAGPPGTSLAGYTYLVIGDASAGGVGVIEEVTDLAGSTIPGDGYFLAAEATFTLGPTPDLVTNINFENSESVTHLLVQGFTGTDGQDLDTDDDGDLDVMPWGSVVDAVGLADDSTDLAYGAFLGFEDVGPDGSFPPGHIFRHGDTGAWTIGPFDPAGGQDTPGSGNATPVASEPAPETPPGYALAAAYPNPFNPTTTLRYTTAEAGPARLAVYDALGREVRVLLDGPQAAGTFTVAFDAADLPSGLYFVRLEAGGRTFTRSVALVK